MSMKRDGNGGWIPVLRVKSNEVVAYTATPGSSTAATEDQVCRLIATTACHYIVGATADTSDVYLPADTIDYVLVPNGQSISVIQSASGGNLHVSVME